jgi:hypothetical protein
MWMFCITLKERNTKRFVLNWHSPFFYIDKTGSTEAQFLGPNLKVVADRAETNVPK